MLIVAPRGRTKDEILRETPSFSSQFFMLTGSVPELEHVVKASIIASDMPRKNFTGVILPKTEAIVE